MAVEFATFKLSALLIPSLKFGMDNSPVSWFDRDFEIPCDSLPKI